jgi:hypothetical protein
MSTRLQSKLMQKDQMASSAAEGPLEPTLGNRPPFFVGIGWSKSLQNSCEKGRVCLPKTGQLPCSDIVFRVFARAGAAGCLVRFGVRKSRENGPRGSDRPQFHGLQRACRTLVMDDVRHTGASPRQS